MIRVENWSLGSVFHELLINHAYYISPKKFTNPLLPLPLALRTIIWRFATLPWVPWRLSYVESYYNNALLRNWMSDGTLNIALIWRECCVTSRDWMTNSIRATLTNRIFVCTGGIFDAHEHRCVSEHNDRARGANCWTIRRLECQVTRAHDCSRRVVVADGRVDTREDLDALERVLCAQEPPRQRNGTCHLFNTTKHVLMRIFRWCNWSTKLLKSSARMKFVLTSGSITWLQA